MFAPRLNLPSAALSQWLSVATRPGRCGTPLMGCLGLKKPGQTFLRWYNKLPCNTFFSSLSISCHLTALSHSLSASFFFTDVSPNKILAPLIPFGLLLLIRPRLTKASYACIVLYRLQSIVTYICPFDLPRVLWGKRGRSRYTHFTSLEIEAWRNQMLYLWCATRKMAPNNPCLQVFTALCIPGGREYIPLSVG